MDLKRDPQRVKKKKPYRIKKRKQPQQTFYISTLE